MKTPYCLRVLIAIDALLQITWRDGKPGVTMSSRMGTAAAHGHKWGEVSFAALDRCYLDIGGHHLGFGKDPATGESHCVGALKSDVLRAMDAIREILGDEVVVARYGLSDFEPELRALVMRKGQT